jgi:flavin reductase (DIM6/NTAB) family NADH-FMN oxidoreductase RutF
MTLDKTIATALRRLEYGVYVVSMGKGTAGNAFTASWVSQVSSEPPLVAISVHNTHQSSQLLESHGAFVINLIAQTHGEVARTYYGPAESGYAKFKNSQVADSPATGTAMINGADGFLDCKIVKTVVVGNHTLFIAEVLAADSQNDLPVLSTSSSKLHYAG